ncbi:hypothetical protein [Spiroplasma endosymbiont of Zeiraphera isertana]|uniref:hypothetical protein n=1 Tax=Spiroplasma endosymbiont of Zeiraphera isertana TaxID=3066313 RepID=UPI00313B0640
MTNNELVDVLKNKKDEEFIKIIRHFKNRIKQIEKKEKLDAIDKKFKEKGIQCPNCKSYWCVKMVLRIISKNIYAKIVKVALML